MELLFSDFLRKDDREEIKLRVNKDVPYLYFENIENTGFVKHGFSTRLGGVSREHLYSMNLGFKRGDDIENVYENYKRFAAALEIDYNSFVLSYQTHTTNILKVGRADMGKGLTKERGYTDVDGLITNEPGVTLTTFYADCVPLLFVDTANRAIGTSHSGWRGTVNKMGLKTVQKMTEEYGTDPKDIAAAIGPSICRDCYEVSGDVISEFERNFSKEIVDNICLKKENGKYMLDLWKANKYVLLEAGILEENISITNICTCCNSELLYSHRASGGLRGNMGAAIQIV